MNIYLVIMGCDGQDDIDIEGCFQSIESARNKVKILLEEHRDKNWFESFKDSWKRPCGGRYEYISIYVRDLLP